MKRSDILVAEISGKRPGDKMKRPTERFNWDFDKVIISNNSDGYETEWPIVMVPEDYQNWYKDNCKMSDIAYYAPMNRSYAIKYAREHGYKYLVQLDDNIVDVAIKYRVVNKDDKTDKSYATLSKTKGIDQLQNDMIMYMADILDNTNVGMVGMTPASGAVPMDSWLNERYVYSFFMLNLDNIPPYFQGDFEDDIEYRLKLKQMKIPSLSVGCFFYGKTSQQGSTKEDLSGNRAAYSEAGLQRGEHMSKLYGDMYERGTSTRGSGTKRNGVPKFRHRVKDFKVGVQVKNHEYLKRRMMELFAKYATARESELKVKIDYPKHYLGITAIGDKYTALGKVISIAIKHGFTLTTKKDPSLDYVLMAETEEGFTDCIDELAAIGEISFEEGTR